MIIFLYGADTYRSRQKLLELKQKFIAQKDKQGLSVSIVQADDLFVDKLRKLILTSGLFAEKRLIIIEGIFKTKQTNQFQEKNKAIIEETINILKKSPAILKKGTIIPKDNVIIFWDEEVREQELTSPQKKLYQFLKKKKYSEEFKPLKLHQVKDWIKKEFKKQGVKIEEKSVELLVDIYGNDLWSLKNEVDKLIALQNGTPSIIHFENLKNIILPKTEQNIWHLIDALGQKNKILTLRLLSDQLKNGASIDYLLSMLAHQYRTIFRIKSYIETNKVSSYYELANQLHLHPFVCQKGLQQEKNYTLEELKKIYQQLLEIDLLRKTRPINPGVLLDLLIIKTS